MSYVEKERGGGERGGRESTGEDGWGAGEDVSCEREGGREGEGEMECIREGEQRGERYRRKRVRFRG